VTVQADRCTTADASMRSAMATLDLERLDVVHAGADTFPLAAHVRALAATSVPRELKAMR